MMTSSHFRTPPSGPTGPAGFALLSVLIGVSVIMAFLAT